MLTTWTSSEVILSVSRRYRSTLDSIRILVTGVHLLLSNEGTAKLAKNYNGDVSVHVSFPAEAGTSPEGHEEACTRNDPVLATRKGDGRPYLGVAS